MYKVLDKVIRNLLTGDQYKTENKINKYIVIHYTTSMSSPPGRAMTTRDNWENAGDASANYVVDDETIVQCVEDFYSAWHCGTTGKYLHKYCRNTNSIGIEMCSTNTGGKTYDELKYQPRDKDWRITDKVFNLTVLLTADLMIKYNIPIENVIRHYDVTGKICPSPFVNNNEVEWKRFKKELQKELDSRKDKEDENMTNETFKKLFDEMRKELQDNDSATWSKEAREWATEEGLFNGNGTKINGEPNYMWQDFLTREQFAAVLYKFYKMIK